MPRIDRLSVCLFSIILASIGLCDPVAAAELQVLHEFTGPDGSDPTGGVIVDPSTGVLYGTTKYGGAGNGTVFSLAPPASATGKWEFKTIHTFQGGTDGSTPSSGLVLDRHLHLLYGTTESNLESEVHKQVRQRV